MRSIFLILSVLLTLAIVGVLVKKQLASTAASVSSTPGLPASSSSSSSSPSSPPKDIQQQYKQALDAAMQPAKRDADEK